MQVQEINISKVNVSLKLRIGFKQEKSSDNIFFSLSESLARCKDMLLHKMKENFKRSSKTFIKKTRYIIYIYNDQIDPSQMAFCI